MTPFLSIFTTTHLIPLSNQTNERKGILVKNLVLPPLVLTGDILVVK